VQGLRLQGQVLADLPVPARGEAESAVNSLDPRAKRYRAADKSLQQARLALQGAQIALADLPRSQLSALTTALESIDKAGREIDNAAASLDDARLESTED
jgi:prefoldin subunit 5